MKVSVSFENKTTISLFSRWGETHKDFEGEIETELISSFKEWKKELEEYYQVELPSSAFWGVVRIIITQELPLVGNAPITLVDPIVLVSVFCAMSEVSLNKKKKVVLPATAKSMEDKMTDEEKIIFLRKIPPISFSLSRVYVVDNEDPIALKSWLKGWIVGTVKSLFVMGWQEKKEELQSTFNSFLSQPH